MNKKIHIYLVIYLFMCFRLTAQKTPTHVIQRENISPRYTDIYSVLVSDSSVKHGMFKRLGYDNEVLLIGKYTLGKKDSLWLEYLRFSKTLISKGFYSDGIKVGVWEYYNANGILSCKYDYITKTQLMTSKDRDGNIIETYASIDSNTQSLKMQREAFFNGSEEQLWKFYKTHLQYPTAEAQKYKICTVFITFLIDENGIAKEHKVLRGINETLNEEALRVTKLLPNNWIPALYDGKNVTTQFMLPVRFIPY